MWGREKNYSYNVSGYGNGQPVSGSLDVLDGSSDVEGILTLDNGGNIKLGMTYFNNKS